ncbi:universal stress protein [Chamaesiphon minutus]|uniref:Universal stress protein UspA-like protein n=1 Tax=Chamaesiphon minutus (strain ATCC 27169 / PCC 6605) TaxID=1173020 RepID=K9UPX5_CHAP6|nr:universal stress protein [Chamaesiphon minutus]AFY96738.1 universal stress protein UspA-like protein [Chamaesiphon minutus PCC 6605]
MLQKILIATGDSSEAHQIFETGLLLAEKLGAKIAILHVLHPVPTSLELVGNSSLMGISPIANDLNIQQSPTEGQDYERQGTERLQLYAKQAQNRQVPAEILQNFGESGRVICDTARDLAAELIVIGSHQKSRLSEMLLGSTSSYVLHHAPCSVMVVREY